LDKKGTVGAVEEDQYIVSAITPLSMIWLRLNIIALYVALSELSDAMVELQPEVVLLSSGHEFTNEDEVC
jgi:hypothetical protein